jgi:tripartite-type tricarboxylate transporter receptor subunit TctC
MKKGNQVIKVIAVALVLASAAGCSRASGSGSSQGGAAAVSADKFPERPITLMVAQSAGGATESGARIWQAYVEKELGVPLNFEFHPGANGQVGLTVISRARSDGYTLGLSDIIALSNSIILQDPEYKVEDFVFIANYQNDPGILMAHKDEPYNTLSELIAYAKTKPPESLTIGVPAMNDVNVIGIRELEEATGVKFNIVSFNGGGKARTAPAGHQIELGGFMYYGSTTIKEETKILGVNVAKTTIPELQGVQTFNDVAGKTLDDIYSINQIMAPAAFKQQYPERYKYIVDAFRRAFSSQEFLEALDKMDQRQWLYPLYGEENDTMVKERWEFCSRVAPAYLKF